MTETRLSRAIRSGSYPPRYRTATQAAGQDKIYLSSTPVNIRRQVDALASRLRDRRYDFLFRPGPWTPELDGEVSTGFGYLSKGLARE